MSDIASWSPQFVTKDFRPSDSALPGNATDQFIDGWVVPTFARPDGNTVGGVTTVRLIVDGVKLTNGKTVSTVGGTFVLKLVNVTNSNAVIATRTIVAGDVNTAGESCDLTVATAATTRNSVSVPDRCLLAGDEIQLWATGTNAADLLKLGARVEMRAHFETQSSVPEI